MSILNITSDGNHSTLIVLFKCLMAHNGRLDKNTLIGLCAPQTAVVNTHQAKNTLRTWLKLGLFEEDDAGCVSLSSSLSIDAVIPDQVENSLPKILRRLLLVEKNNRDIWGNEHSLAADFTRSLSWILAQNVYTVPGGGHPAIEKLEEGQIKNKDERIFQNSTRWAGFKAWASFVGFGWISAVPDSKTLIVDPRLAVQDELDIIFADSRELPAENFFQILAERLPVIDGGRYRLEVEARISSETWKKPKPEEISTSLTRALIQLNETGIIALASKGDADKKILLGQGERRRKVSHVLYKAEA